MAELKISFYGGILLIAAEVFVISFLNYAVIIYLPDELGQYVSLDVLLCLPILQTARLAATCTMRRYDTQTAVIVGIILAFVWSASEAVVFGPDFPIVAFVLNTFTRSVVFTVIGRVLVKLWREREYAHRDMLTGLATRLELLERLGIEQARSERSRRPYSLLFIDIDQFKAINDKYGHKIGDEVLKQLAYILRESTRKVDIAARLGGDEFVLLLPDSDEASCNIVIRRIETSTKKSFEEQSWPISISIGQATCTGKSQTADWLIQNADENMYEVKRMKQQMMQV